jgi:hypothetical protein
VFQPRCLPDRLWSSRAPAHAKDGPATNRR